MTILSKEIMKYIYTLIFCLAINILYAQNIIKCNLGDFHANKNKVSLYAHSKPNSTELDYIVYSSPWLGTVKIPQGTYYNLFCKNLNTAKEKFYSWNKETKGVSEMKGFKKEIARNPVFKQGSGYNWFPGEMSWYYWIDLANNPYIMINIDESINLYIAENEIERFYDLFMNADSLFSNHPYTKMDKMLK